MRAGRRGPGRFWTGRAIVGSDGKRRSTWVFRIVLSHSRKGYAEAVHRQTTDDFLRCLENAFAHFGGLPRTLVIDNLRAAVKRADWFDPELCPKVRSFAEHYGIAILPTKPYTPRHKGKIERGIGYVKGNALKGRTFSSLADQNQHLQAWEATVADTRIHGTTRRQVKEVFQQAEQPALLPLPAARFDLFAEALRSVSRDGHVQVKGAYYSVPPEFLGRQLWRAGMAPDPLAGSEDAPRRGARAASAGDLLHAGCPYPAGEDQRDRKRNGLAPAPGRIHRTARHAVGRSMLQNRGIEGVRVLLGLMSLTNKHSRRVIEQACQVAQGHGAYHLRSLRQLLEQQNPPALQRNFEFVQEHPIIRDLGDYGRFVRQAITQQPPSQESIP